MYPSAQPWPTAWPSGSRFFGNAISNSDYSILIESLYNGVLLLKQHRSTPVLERIFSKLPFSDRKKSQNFYKYRD